MSLPALPETPANCIDCGACCLSYQADYIRVFSVDYARMDERTRALTVVHDERRAMRFRDGHCSALIIDKARKTLSCSIYPQRPDACRWLKQGSQPCREQLRDKGVRALALLQ